MTTNITAIRGLLADDIDRAHQADDTAERTHLTLEIATAVGDHDEAERLARRLREAHASAISARQSFAARTELLQHIDLADETVEGIIHQAVNRPGSVPADSAPAAADPAPDATAHLTATHTTTKNTKEQ
jgi:hypothetical protein